jgi:hypothetical protein
MEHVRLTSPFFAKQNLSQSDVLFFKPGQIFQGKVTKLFPNQTAEIQAGSHKFIARLEAPLSNHERYLFQVQPGEGKIHLKVLTSQEVGMSPSNQIKQVLAQLSLPVTKENLEIFRSFLQKELPISKEIVQLSSEWLKTAPSLQEGIEVIRQMIVKNLPFRKEVFNALSSLQKNEPLHNLASSLLSSLKGTMLTENGEKLKNALEELTITVKDVSGQAKAIATQLKKVMSIFGFDYEHSLLKNAIEEGPYKADTLKPLLLRFLQEQPSTLQKEAAEHLLNRITGMQVLAQETGPIMQFAVQIPLSFWSKTTDLTIQWSGRRKPNGQIDPDYCRILFYLDLEHLQETIIDLEVQNRIISMTVINENEDVKKIAEPFMDELKENLSSIHYHLSAVRFATKEDQLMKRKQAAKKIHHLFHSNEYQGVDIKI